MLRAVVVGFALSTLSSQVLGYQYYCQVCDYGCESYCGEEAFNGEIYCTRGSSEFDNGYCTCDYDPSSCCTGSPVIPTPTPTPTPTPASPPVDYEYGIITLSSMSPDSCPLVDACIDGTDLCCSAKCANKYYVTQQTNGVVTFDPDQVDDCDCYEFNAQISQYSTTTAIATYTLGSEEVEFVAHANYESGESGIIIELGSACYLEFNVAQGTVLGDTYTPNPNPNPNPNPDSDSSHHKFPVLIVACAGGGALVLVVAGVVAGVVVVKRRRRVQMAASQEILLGRR